MNEILVNIIAVDDNEGDLQLLKNALTDDGIINYKLFTDAEKFLEEVEKNECPVCIIDHLLGSQTGYEIMLKVKSIAAHSFIIILSGYGDVYEFTQYANAKADRFVLKNEPLYIKKLLSFVTEGIRYQLNYLTLKQGIKSL